MAKCNDDWDVLQNAYLYALKSRKNKKWASRCSEILRTNDFLQISVKWRPSTTKPMSLTESPECFESSNLLQESPEPESVQSYQWEHRPETPHSVASSHAQRSSRNKTNLQDEYELILNLVLHDLRLQKQQDTNETALFILSTIKAPKCDQTKINQCTEANELLT